MKTNTLRNDTVSDSAVDHLVSLLDHQVRITAEQAADLFKSYQAATPFPHVVIDNLFSDALLEPLLDEVASMKRNQFVQVGGAAGVQKVLRMRSVVEIGRAGQHLLNLLHSAPFLYLLSEITGIWQLLPDPYLQGGGNAVMRPGDFFKIHTDRSIAYETGLTRRLAMIIFLNKAWDSAFGGQLELWDHQATQCVQSIEPLFNRTVIFEVANPNFHGVPTPLSCPQDRTRQSFLVYFHTVGADQATNLHPHSSIFAPGFYRKKKSRMQNLAELVTPPIVRRASEKLAAVFRKNSA